MQPTPEQPAVSAELGRGALHQAAGNGQAAPPVGGDDDVPAAGIWPARVVAPPIDAAPSGSNDPYVMVRRALRGRYAQFIVLGLLGACIGAVAGWRAAKPLFQSTAEIRIAYSVPAVVDPNADVNKWIQPYETIIRAQEQVIVSRPIIEKAVQLPAWRDAGGGTSPAAVRDFQTLLAAQRITGSDHLRVVFQDNDPALAAAGVNAVVAAYVSDFRAREDRVQDERIARVQEGINKVQKRIDELDAKALSISREFGVGDLETLYNLVERRAALLEAKSVDLQSGATATGVAIPQPAVTQAASAQDVGPARPMTAAELAAAGDVVMRDFLADQARLQGAVEDQMRVRGLGPEHPEVKLLKQQLLRATERVEAHVKESNATQALLARYPAGPAAVTVNGQPVQARTPEMIRADLAQITRLLDDAKTKLNEMAPRRQEARLAKAEADQMRLELARLRGREQTLSLETLPASGRVEVIEPGAVSVRPFRDPRPKYAAAGAFGGGALPAALVVLLGLVNRRYRFSDEAESELAGSAPLLGILPALPHRLTDSEQASAAAQCLHQIRVMLQVGGTSLHSPGAEGVRKRGTFLVTSSTPGEGKTSVAVSLGLSFAAAGCRTIVIDCDMIGQRVTRGFDLRGLAGLRDALHAGTVRGYARKAACGLWVLPVGGADALDACAVSWGEMRRLLADARRYFDTIIIDSGPILGSVEATTVAPLCDGVIFTVSRGQQPPLVEKALRHLDSIGARVSGFVFNRARAKDFSRSAHASSLRSISADAIPTLSLMGDTEATGRFGPLVQSVVSLLPASRALMDSGGGNGSGNGASNGDGGAKAVEVIAAGDAARV